MAAQQAVLLIALAIIFLLGFSAVDAGYVATGDDFNVTNESFTTDPGNWTTLQNSNIDGAAYHDDEVVYDENGTKMVEGQDYEWNRTNGTVKAVAGGDLDPAQNANISYNYTTFSDEQQGFMALFTGLMEPATSLLIVLAVVVILAGMRVLTGV